MAHCILTLYRCTANAKDLDGGGGRRSREHTEELVESFGLKALWEEYGLVGDVTVCGLRTPNCPETEVHLLALCELVSSCRHI